MRWLYMILLCAVLHTISAGPDPKKYKSEATVDEKKKLTDDERKFLREVEEKFGVKSDTSINVKKIETSTVSENKTATNDTQKPPFPAVIAIEIVNDTETNSKGKRTIDANLGYGYRTNNGYSYSYFGKPAQEKGKFMIYPYSQEDIPSKHNVYSGNHGQSYSNGKHTPHSQTSVEIQPSQAFELVSVKDENAGYDYSPPASQLSYDNANTHDSTSYTKSAHPSTLYTTYNGEGFSGLSGQFPSIMPNYFVDPTQLIKNPQYQSVGLTPEHLRTHGSHLERRVVPVLVLRIPSSYLKNPTAELYANLPNNYPLSQHLNNVNLQELVNQYFKKNGYPFAPQVMAYQTPVSTAQSAVSSNHEPHHYANPYVQPAYTHADYSGVQYSAVKPVMAKYPLSYTQQKYIVPATKSVYRRPMQQQQYEYQYQYVPSTAQPQQTYYVQEQEYKTPETADATHQYQQDQASIEHQTSLHDPVTQVQYRTSQQDVSQEAKETVEYEAPQNAVQETHQSVASYYESPQAETAQYEHSQDVSAYAQQQASQAQPEYSSSSSEYYTPKKTDEKQTVSVYPSQLIHSENYQEHSSQNLAQEYVYQTQNSDASHGLALSENYPSKDHTIATVLPFTYKQSGNPGVASVQTVSYVTPMPSLKYQSRYKIMVPQTVLKNPNSEKVSYVNSHSVSPQYYQPNQYTQESTEQEYSAGTQYVPPVPSKSTYTRNYYGHLKRQAKPDSKAAASSSSSTVARKPQKSEEKKSA
ncbi:uncharacterized protein [Epargyreus clarus]|uniref:uncharacterized protein isoform X2 n=1 Tax=Epargyreus clarus TaxID=520877 RepID=UPI003C2D87A7